MLVLDVSVLLVEAGLVSFAGGYLRENYLVIDGGAASGALPQFLFGSGPICRTSLPPSTSWRW
jgi:hypothetical protein